jgi:hypothetical protein
VAEGQGTVIHFTIPTRAPWIPLRILALGKTAAELVDADLFVLTDDVPSLGLAEAELPGLTVRSAARATPSLLQDLRSDRGMGWVPAAGMWLTALTLHTKAGFIRADLSIDGGGPVGVERSPVQPAPAPWPTWLAALIALAGLATVWFLWRPAADRVRTA